MTGRDPNSLKDGTLVLGLEVWRDHRTTVEASESSSGTPCHNDALLVGRFPVCGELHAATIMKRRTTAITKGWYDIENDIPPNPRTGEVTKVHQDDQARGDCCVTGEEFSTSIGACTLATGVVLKRNDSILEDACWFCKTIWQKKTAR